MAECVTSREQIAKNIERLVCDGIVTHEAGRSSFFRTYVLPQFKLCQRSDAPSQKDIRFHALAHSTHNFWSRLMGQFMANRDSLSLATCLHLAVAVGQGDKTMMT